MLRELTFKQLQEWMQYDAISPIGPERGDWQAASVASSVLNAAYMLCRRSKRVQVKDMLLKFGQAEPKVKQSWKSMKRIAGLWAAAFASKEKTDGR